MATHEFTVSGMACDGCESAVENAVSELDGVESVRADHETDAVTVDTSGDLDEIQATIENAGYEVES